MTDIAWPNGKIDERRRTKLLGQRPCTVWLTGLSGSGKSTTAFALERRLSDQGKFVYVLDGDDIRRGLCRDLGFSEADRRENIRRVAEVAQLMNDAGLIVISAFISPYREDRQRAREIIGEERFIEIHLSASLATCEARDPKGLYKRARRGQIAHFTGIDAPYEVPEAPRLRVDTSVLSIDQSVDLILGTLLEEFLACGVDKRAIARQPAT